MRILLCILIFFISCSDDPENSENQKAIPEIEPNYNALVTDIIEEKRSVDALEYKEYLELLLHFDIDEFTKRYSDDKLRNGLNRIVFRLIDEKSDKSKCIIRKYEYGYLEPSTYFEFCWKIKDNRLSNQIVKRISQFLLSYTVLFDNELLLKILGSSNNIDAIRPMWFYMHSSSSQRNIAHDLLIGIRCKNSILANLMSFYTDRRKLCLFNSMTSMKFTDINKCKQWFESKWHYMHFDNDGIFRVDVERSEIPVRKEFWLPRYDDEYGSFQ